MNWSVNKKPATTKLLADLEALKPEILSRVEEFESSRRIPKDIIDKLEGIGIFHALLPEEFGGLGVGTEAGSEILEAVAKIDGSLAWTTMIGFESPQILSLLPRETFEGLYKQDTYPLMGGTFMPNGTAQEVDGGYMVSGRWGFSSGCQNWNLQFGNCVILDKDGNKTEGRLPGTAKTRSMMFTRDQYELEETWFTMGMRGTGSNHFTVKETFIPHEHTFDMLLDKPSIEKSQPFPVLEFNLHITAVLLGIAQGAVDDFIGIANFKKRNGQTTQAAKNPLIQYRVGRAQSQLNAARSFLRNVSETMGNLSGEETLQEMMAIVAPHNAWIAEITREIVDTVWELSGAASSYDGSVFQRRLRDIKVATQHGGVADAAWASLGAELMGETYVVIPPTQVALDEPKKEQSLKKVS
jgi:alkylation response protein AidB-like acyl-CoA dehydrogenase